MPSNGTHNPSHASGSNTRAPPASQTQSDSPPTQTGGSSKRKRQSARDEEDIFEKQDPEVKAKLGRDYRELLLKADEMQSNVANVSAVQLRNVLQAGDELFRNVRDTGIASLDARLLHTTTDTAVNMARKMKIDGNAFDVDEFMLKLTYKLGLYRAEEDDVSNQGDSEDELGDSQGRNDQDGSGRERTRIRIRKGVLGDWQAIGWMASSLSRRVPGLEFMYGPLQVRHEPRARAPARQKAAVAPETRPEAIEQTQAPQNVDKDTTVHVVRVTKILQRLDPDGEGINFFRLVVNPDSYGQTVENIFFASFIIRDGRAALKVLEDGEIIIINTPDGAQPGGEVEVNMNQAVIELDQAAWQSAKDLFDITESSIPNRVFEQTQLAANAWYR